MARQTRRIIQPIIIGRLNDDEEIACVNSGLRSEHFISVLGEVRQLNIDTFKKREEEWADGNITTLNIATLIMYQLTIERVGIETADLALLGARLGGAVLRNLSEEGTVSLETSRQNLNSWRVAEDGFGTVYDGTDIDYSGFSRLLGTEAADGLAQVKSPASRTVCGAVIGLCLIPGFEDQG